MGRYFPCTYLVSKEQAHQQYQGRNQQTQTGDKPDHQRQSHLPYLLYPYITISDSVTSPQMGVALVIGFIAGLCLLVPSLILLMRLFLFDTKYVQGK